MSRQAGNDLCRGMLCATPPPCGSEVCSSSALHVGFGICALLVVTLQQKPKIQEKCARKHYWEVLRGKDHSARCPRTTPEGYKFIP